MEVLIQNLMIALKNHQKLYKIKKNLHSNPNFVPLISGSNQTHLFKSICLLLKVKPLIKSRLYFDPHNFIMRVKIDGFFEAEAPLAYSTYIITDAFNSAVG